MLWRPDRLFYSPTSTPSSAEQLFIPKLRVRPITVSAVALALPFSTTQLGMVRKPHHPSSRKTPSPCAHDGKCPNRLS